jgi:signal transduction histidine kinase
MGLSQRTVLRAGYGSVIALLLFASVEAYRIQNTVSEQHVEIYRRYVQQDAAVAQLRRTIWLAGNYVRDFFIKTSPAEADLLKKQLVELEKQSQEALEEIDKLRPSGAARRGLDIHLDEFWRAVRPIPQTMLNASDAEQYAFVQEEIVPRRSSVSNVLRELTAAEQQALQQSEADFGELRRSATRRLIFMLGFSVILALAVSRLSLRYSESLEKEKNRQYEEAVRARREQEQLSARLLEIEEDGKKKLSRELHDEIGQTLAVLQIEITNALAVADKPSGAVKERLRRARDLAERIVQTVRNIALLLRPALLDDLGLVPALQWQLEDFGRRSGITCDFSGDGVDDMLPDSVKTCVYRVVQEALHNCEKHAGANRVSVALHQLPDSLVVEVRDNGRGFELNEKSMPRRNAGLGILGMRERAARMGGTMTIETSPGRGTHLIMRIPLAPPVLTSAAPVLRSEVGA